MPVRPHRLEPILLAAILLVAAFFRFHDLRNVPPGLTHDEADVGFYAAAVARGEPIQYRVPYGYAYEPFGQISAGLLMKLLGPTDFALRVHQTLYGLLVVGLVYAWARMAFGSAVAAGAALLAAVSFWTVFTSRMALNSQPVPAVFLLAVVSLWRALYGLQTGRGTPRHAPRTRHAGRYGWWLAFALSVGAMLYIYEAARAVWFTLPAFGVYLLLTRRARFRQEGVAFALSLGAGTALALPHLLDPGAWGRTGALAGALTALRSGDPGPLITNALEGLGTLTMRGDTLVTYNLPGRPLLGPVVGLFFYLGLVVCLARIRRPGSAFLLLWLGFGLIPTLVIGAYTSTLHSIAVQPVVCILPAIGAVTLVRALARRDLRKLAAGFAALWAVVLALTGAQTAREYFVTWGRSADVRAAYFHTLAEITARLNADPGGVVELSSPFPEPPLDPFIGQLRVQNSAVDLRWMDARLAVLLPSVDEARLIASADAPLDAHLADLLRPEHVERVELRPDDFNPHYDVYRLRPNEARARLADLMRAPAGGQRAAFGGAVELLGCRVDAAQIVPGGTLEVGTLWTVLDPGALGPIPPTQYTHELVIFVHALDKSRALIGQQDVLGVPASDWRAGDAFLHVHRIALPDPLPDGRVRLQVGLYRRPDVERLPLTVGGRPAGDALELPCSDQ